MLTRLLRGALESHARVRAARPIPSSSAPATRRSRSSARTRTTTTSARRSTGSTTTGSGARGARRSGSASTSSPAPASAAAGPGTGATLHEEQMHIEPDGTFEVIISQREHPGNWLRSEADTRSLAIRQTFLDKRNQEHAELHIERIGGDGSPPEPLTAEDLYLVAALRRALREGRRRHRRPVGDPPGPVAERVHRRGRGRPRPTSSRTRRSSGTRRTSTSPTTRRSSSRSRRPTCEYWMIALHNHWMETLDYVHHQATLNCHSAQLEADGSVRFVDRPPRSRACRTGSTPPATSAAPSACAGSAPTSSTSCRPPGSFRSANCPERDAAQLTRVDAVGEVPALRSAGDRVRRHASGGDLRARDLLARVPGVRSRDGGRGGPASDALSPTCGSHGPRSAASTSSSGFRPELWRDRAGRPRPPSSRFRHARGRPRRLHHAGHPARRGAVAGRQRLRRRLRRGPRRDQCARGGGHRRRRDLELALPPRSRPHRFHRRHREPEPRSTRPTSR